MKILVTGADGFVGKNLISTLENIRDGKDKSFAVTDDIEIFKYDIGSTREDFLRYCSECDFVFNLVGVHRPKDDSEFMKGNFGFLSELIEMLEKCGNNCPVMFSSSIQAKLNNPYGESKRAAEEALLDYSKRTGARDCIYRFSNLFGKWSRPDYNSVVSTFCYHIAHDLPIQITDRNHEISLIYIDDVINELIACLTGNEKRKDGFCFVPAYYDTTLGELADLIYSFRDSRKTLVLPDFTDGGFSKKLYSTYLSYLPENEFSYPLCPHSDERGSFTEILKSTGSGQVSVNVAHPGIVKGQHWHHTKNEKFLVVSGNGVIRFRKIDSDKVIEYYVSDKKPEIVDIPTGYTHNIENLGDTDMITLMWCNECFNPDKPDTYFLPVSSEQKAKAAENQVLVLGGAGMAGHMISYYLREKGYDVTVFDKLSLDGFSCIIGSAFDTQTLKSVLTAKRYDAVINCIGLLNKACDDNRGAASFLNGYFPHFLEDELKDTATKLIHISSDCVFLNSENPYIESDIPNAVDNYGRTKAVGEVINDKDVTFRTSIVGPDTVEGKNGLVNWFFRQKESVNGFTNVIWSGVSTIVLAKAAEKAISENISGIYHLVNNDYISKYDMLCLFNKYLKCEEPVDLKKDESVYQKKVLKNTRSDFSFEIPSYKEMIKEIADWINTHKEIYSHYWK